MNLVERLRAELSQLKEAREVDMREAFEAARAREVGFSIETRNGKLYMDVDGEYFERAKYSTFEAYQQSLKPPTKGVTNG